MDVNCAIKKRKSIRKYKVDAISRDIIKEIIDSGRLAPSAKNRQPWRFVVITKKEIIDKIANIMIETHTEFDDDYAINKLKSFNSVIATAEVIKQVPVLVLIFRERDNNWIIGDNLSIGACVENMCLRACEFDLGTLWIRDTVYAQNEIIRIVGFDKEVYELNCALAIGIPDQDPIPRPRFALEEITTWME